MVRLVARCAGPARICTVSSIDGSSIAIFCSRRASARSFSMCLNSSNVVEPIDAQLAGRQDRLDQRREIHRAAGGGAGADGGVDFVDEEDRHRPLRRAR